VRAANWIGVSIELGQRAAMGQRIDPDFGPPSAVRTGHDMSREEIRALEERYGCAVLPEAYL
jgi:hypothetical protein